MRRFNFSFSATEIKQLAISTVAIAFAFSLILFRDEIFIQHRLAGFPVYFLYALIAVGLAFILHELGHKFVAQQKGCWAEFRAWPAGLVMAVVLAVLSLGRFVFAAPGAVVIVPAKKTRFGFAIMHLEPEDMGLIGAAGPIVNIVLAALFVLLGLVIPFSLFSIAAQVNAWLAIFNMIPFGLLDGYKVWRWSPFIWAALMGLSVLVFAFVVFI